jgi:hypothetical protein
VADQLDFMENLVGDYPFPTYGSFVVDAPLGFALESQTLTVWFGDSVAPARWSDVWHNEGQASW